MPKLSKESAEKHYEKLSALHYFKYLTLAQKVSIFYHDLEHDILIKITGKRTYFEQFNWLKDNQIRVNRNIKTGQISKVNISDIDNLKNWRNEGIHENKMPEAKYKSHFHTMANLISFFSEIQIPDEINNILTNRKKSKTSNNDNNELEIKKGKNKSIKITNEKLSLNITTNDTVYSSINKNVSQWSFNIQNARFLNDLNIILEDQENKIIYHFFLRKGTINEPRKIFNQRNDDRVSNKSIVSIPTNDKSFPNKFNNREFKFVNYLKNKINY